MSSIWDNKSKFSDRELFFQVDDFFNNIEKSKYLQYRDGQRSMAYSVLDTIRDKQVLLIEAGVGIGKSYAYLIPLILSIKNDPKFKGFVIATSTIALQEQLIDDVEKVSKMLNVPSIDVVLAKGKNNYICRRRLNDFLKTTGNEKYQYILDEVLKSDSIDRKDFQDISDKMWNNFNVKVCANMACPYYTDCKIRRERDSYKNAKVIITNQDLLINDLKKSSNERLLGDNKTIVIDEAHNLEEKIRNSYVMALDKRYIEALLYHLYYSVSDYDESFLVDDEVFNDLTNFFVTIRSNAKNEIRKINSSIDNYINYNRVRFSCNSKLEEVVKKLIDSISKAINIVVAKNSPNRYNIDKKSMEKLEQFNDILHDILRKEKSKNIYWVDFIDYNGKYLRLTYAPKKIDDISAALFSKINPGVILTSATLTTGGNNYDYYSKSIGLDKIVGKSVLKEFPEKSPYDYDENSILYCPTDIPSPKDKDEYLDAITNRIRELMTLTGGKTLVLFTSKDDMNYVYKKIDPSSFDFKVYVQNDSDVKKIKDEFEKDTSSCLFATGSFYEGIDVKGSSLSQVIIAKLPFSIVDPVMNYKSSNYVDGFESIYLPDMITKLKQGTGRAIRSESDTAVISILDSRINNYNIKYDNAIFDALPFSNITDNIDEVEKFVKKKIK